MSTRSTICYGKYKGTEFHMYSDFMDDRQIHIELSGNVEFSSSSNVIDLAIPVQLWELLRKYTHAEITSKLVMATPAELHRWAENGVEWNPLRGHQHFKTVKAKKAAVEREYRKLIDEQIEIRNVIKSVGKIKHWPKDQISSKSITL